MNILVLCSILVAMYLMLSFSEMTAVAFCLAAQQSKTELTVQQLSFRHV